MIKEHFGAVAVVIMADGHIGRRYNWENYDWLYSAFDGISGIYDYDAAMTVDRYAIAEIKDIPQRLRFII